MGFITAVTGAYLDISDTAGFQTWIWALVGFLTLIVAPFLAFHKVRVERDRAWQELNRLKDVSPKLSVDHFIGPDEQDHGRGYLRVRNVGGFTKAWGTARVVNGVMDSERWKEHWKVPWRGQYQGEPAELPKGHEQVLSTGIVLVVDPGDDASFGFVLRFPELDGTTRYSRVQCGGATWVYQRSALLR